MPDQEQIDWPPEYKAQENWPELLELIKSVSSDLGRERVIQALDCKPSHLDNALVDRDRHSLKARELFYFLLADPSGRILRYLAQQCGYEVDPMRPLSPEEKLLRLERRACEKFGELGKQLIEEAYRR